MPDLLDAAALEDREPVAHRQRLVLVVGDVDEGDADLPLERLELDLHLLAELQVEGAERLVEEQDARAVDQRAGEGHALALAAGELAGPASPKPGELAPASSISSARARGARPLGTPLDHEPVGHVLGDGHVGEERVVLEDGVDVALVGRHAGDVLAVEEDPARVGLLEAGDQAQAGRLARARRPEQREELAVVDLEAHLVDGADVAEAAADTG